ncbi:MAG TPA: hypothetical protein VK438_04385 [Xanthobacteraceae bacterium]|nr:hypothetical protein [Xanthobacteraceae bacterium]
MSETDLVPGHGGSEYEPLLPVEKKLIGWSLGIGVVLLIVLVIFSDLIPSRL